MVVEDPLAVFCKLFVDVVAAREKPQPNTFVVTTEHYALIAGGAYCAVGGLKDLVPALLRRSPTDAPSPTHRQEARQTWRLHAAQQHRRDVLQRPTVVKMRPLWCIEPCWECGTDGYATRTRSSPTSKPYHCEGCEVSLYFENTPADPAKFKEVAP